MEWGTRSAGSNGATSTVARGAPVGLDKIYAESFTSDAHHAQIVAEAKEIVTAALG